MIDPKKRLAIFAPSMRGGRAERVTLSPIQGMAGRGHTVDPVLAQAEGPYLVEVSESVRFDGLLGRVPGNPG